MSLAGAGEKIHELVNRMVVGAANGRGHRDDPPEKTAAATAGRKQRTKAKLKSRPFLFTKSYKPDTGGSLDSDHLSCTAQ